MWTVVYVAQKSQEIFRVKTLLDDNKIICRIRESRNSDEEHGMYFEIMVPAAELSAAQNLILDSEI
ncbi:MAG: hypothetical protein SOZ34_05245 [Clostridia bacterium]|nr:hypothetical protein [Clostridia bacterium]